MSGTKRSGLERDFAVLELGPEATLVQVKSAYLRLKKLYSSDSPLLAPIAREFPEEKRLRILSEIEDAYQRLLGQFLSESAEDRPSSDGASPALPLSPAPESTPAAPETVFTGPVLKKIREDLGIPLQAIFQSSKVRIEQLEAIEAENFEKLPDETYLRIQLKEYAGHLLLNPGKVTADYLKRFADWKKTHPRPGR